MSWRCAGLVAHLAGLGLLLAVSGGCNSSATGSLSGDLQSTNVIRVEGPLTLNVQGPVVKFSGVYISPDLLGRVEVLKTRPDWLLAVFGEPTGRAQLSDSSEIWRWTYGPLEQEGAILSVFGGGSKEAPRQQPWTVFLHIRGGVVVEKWHS